MQWGSQVILNLPQEQTKVSSADWKEKETVEKDGQEKRRKAEVLFFFFVKIMYSLDVRL